MTPFLLTPSDAILLGRRTHLHRTTLREIPDAIRTACGMIRGLIDELEGTPEEARLQCISPRTIDALLVCISGAAAHLSDTAIRLVGENDEDEPVIQ